MEKDADKGASVIGDAGALLRGDGRVRVAGKHHGEAFGAEGGAEFSGEGERNVFFFRGTAEMGSWVGTAVGGVNEKPRFR